MKSIHFVIIISLIGLTISCNPPEKSETSEPTVSSPEMTSARAQYLYQFAYECIDQEYPNKTGHTLGSAEDLAAPSEMHPAFYGCFDWHSAVHGHWTLINLIRIFPDLEYRDEIIQKLKRNITKENIEKEVAYLQGKHNKSFERTYGWVWLLKLAEALDQWNDPLADSLQSNLQPLTDLIEEKMMEFLPKLTYPIRIGEHSNTAFALSFALDYARTFQRTELEALIISRAKEYYMADQGCPIGWEPGGFDFLSPCLQEASLMGKVLSQEDYKAWLRMFLPNLLNDPQSSLTPVIVSDRGDGKLAHLDGLNFSRAWCLYEIGYSLNDPNLIQLANEHFEFSYENISADHYEGSHWLASFALYALTKSTSN
jgi:hypothetical protein